MSGQEDSGNYIVSSHNMILNFIVKNLMSICGKKVTYHGDSETSQLNKPPSDVHYESVQKFELFLDHAVSPKIAEELADKFNLNTEYLILEGKNWCTKTYEREFHFSYIFAKQKQGAIQYASSQSNKLRNYIYELMKLQDQNAWTVMFSSILYFWHKISIAWLTFLKSVYVIGLLLYWKVAMTKKNTEDLNDQFLWVPSGSEEITFQEDKLSLPLYLKEFLKTRYFPGIKFAVVCPFLKGSQNWSMEHSFSVPNLRHINPGVSWKETAKYIGYIVRILLNIPIGIFRNNGYIELLSLLPQLFLKKVWLENTRIKALFVTESCAGVPMPLVHAAKEVKIPVIMVFYSTDVIPLVLDKKYQQVVPIEFQNLLADYFFVWSECMKEGLLKAKYSSENILVAGPQMFAPSNGLGKNKNKPKKDLVIGIFDIFPMKEIQQVMFGRAEFIRDRNYFIAFRKELYETIKSVFGNRVKVIHKLKRKSVNIRDVDFSEEFGSSLDGLIVEEKEAGMNPWAVLDQSDIVISIPFTSMSVAALAMGKPAAFYDPSCLIQPRLKDQVEYLSGKEELFIWLVGLKEKYEYDGDISGKKENFGAEALALALKNISDSGLVSSTREKNKVPTVT